MKQVNKNCYFCDILSLYISIYISRLPCICSGYLPPPIHPSQLAQRLLQQQKYERLDEGGEVQEIEMELEENEPEKESTENKEMVGSGSRRVVSKLLVKCVFECEQV